ncbi:hypothetical protein TWF225_005358 [Orbilia oligospora]|nr:hypothetical protein TWF225_005358 [Orbilia oligospora]KAF3257471.1 hypothetical protein TWF128_005030 [Orbilia oligospora]KAF3295245.1 hypothetical protein TWF132_001942 [Orbilia oligospora]
MPIQSRITKAVAGLPDASSDATSYGGCDEAFEGLDDAFLEAAFSLPAPSSPRASSSTGSSLAAPPPAPTEQSQGREGANSRASNRMPTELDPAQICDVWGYYLSEATPNGGWFSQEDRDGLLEYLENKVRTTPWQLFISPFTATKLVQQRGWSFTESKNTAYANRAIYDSCADFFKLHAIICHQMFSIPQQSGPTEPKSESVSQSFPSPPHRVIEVESIDLMESLNVNESNAYGGPPVEVPNKPEGDRGPDSLLTASSSADKGKKRKMSDADLDQGGRPTLPHINRASTPHPYKRTRRSYPYENRPIAEDPTSEGTAPKSINYTIGEDPAVAIARYQYLSRKAELEFQLEVQKLEYQRQREEMEARYKAEEADKQRYFELEKLRLELSLQELRLRAKN